MEGYARLLKDEMKHDYIDRILESSQRATGVVKSLLTFSKKQNVEPKLIDLNGVIREIERMLHPLAKGVVCFCSNLSDVPLTVLADNIQLQRVVLNFALNAVEAMPKGGQLTVTTEPFLIKEDFIEKHGYGACGSFAHLSISDTGVGISKSEMAKIFEPFYTTKKTGTGLGLAIVYGIIKQHNGYINVDSEPHCGTTFHVYLPLVNNFCK